MDMDETTGLTSHVFNNTAMQRDVPRRRFNSFMIAEILEDPEDHVRDSRSTAKLQKCWEGIVDRRLEQIICDGEHTSFTSRPMMIGPMLASSPIISPCMPQSLPLPLSLSVGFLPTQCQLVGTKAEMKLCQPAGLPVQQKRPPAGARRARRNRTVFTERQLTNLEHRFDRQKYLSTPDRLALAASLGLSQLQVKTWYQNRRMKWKKIVVGSGLASPTKPKGRPRKDSIPSVCELGHQEEEK